MNTQHRRIRNHNTQRAKSEKGVGFISTRVRLSIAVGGGVKVKGIKVYLCHGAHPPCVRSGEWHCAGGVPDNLLFYD